MLLCTALLYSTVLPGLLLLIQVTRAATYRLLEEVVAVIGSPADEVPSSIALIGRNDPVLCP